ncbi:MAG: hypothetical protein U0L11_08265 [Acutalibacteraceae bacterium]|nr:hypothetical protein [Acutalibacteraceae bacterium]
MNNKKSLRQLGEEYENAAAQVKRRIDKKRAQLRALKDSICSNDAYELKRELQLLYAEHREAVEIAEYLKNYYEPHCGKRELFSYK